MRTILLVFLSFLTHITVAQDWKIIESIKGGKVNDILISGDTMLLATNGGVYFSTNGYQDFKLSKNGLGTAKYGFKEDNCNITKIEKATNGYLALSSQGFIYKSKDKGSAWQVIDSNLYVEDFKILDNGIMYFYGYDRRSKDKDKYLRFSDNFGKLFNDFELYGKKFEDIFGSSKISSFKDTLHLADKDSVYTIVNNAKIKSVKKPTAYTKTNHSIVSLTGNSYFLNTKSSSGQNVSEIFLYDADTFNKMLDSNIFLSFNLIYFYNSGNYKIAIVEFEPDGQRYTYLIDKDYNYELKNFPFEGNLFDFVKYKNDYLFATNNGLEKSENPKSKPVIEINTGINARNIASVVNFENKIYFTDSEKGLFNFEDTNKLNEINQTSGIGLLNTSKTVLYGLDAYEEPRLRVLNSNEKVWNSPRTFSTSATGPGYLFSGLVEDRIFIKEVAEFEKPNKIFITQNLGQKYDEITNFLPDSLDNQLKIVGKPTKLLVHGLHIYKKSQNGNLFEVSPLYVTDSSGKAWKRVPFNDLNFELLGTSYVNNEYYALYFFKGFADTKLKEVRLYKLNKNDSLEYLSSFTFDILPLDFNQNLKIQILNNRIYICGENRVTYTDISFNYEWNSTKLPNEYYEVFEKNAIAIRNDTAYAATNGFGVVYAPMDTFFIVKEKPIVETRVNRDILYPNPAINELNLKLEGNSDFVRYWIYDLAGKKLIEKEIQGSGTQYKINIDELRQGLYIIKIQTRDNIRTYKFYKKKV